MQGNNSVSVEVVLDAHLLSLLDRPAILDDYDPDDWSFENDPEYQAGLAAWYAESFEASTAEPRRDDEDSYVEELLSLGDATVDEDCDVEFTLPTTKLRGKRLADAQGRRRRSLKKRRHLPWSKEEREARMRSRNRRFERREVMRFRTGYYDFQREVESREQEIADRNELKEFIRSSERN